MKKINYLLLFVLFLNFFFFRSIGLFSLALFTFAVWLLSIKLFDNNSKKTNTIKWWGSALMILTTSTMVYFSSPEKIVLLVLLAVEIMAVSIYIWLKDEQINGLLELGLSGLIIIKNYFLSGLKVFFGFFNGSLKELLQVKTASKKEKSPWVKSVVVGLLVGLPLVALLVSILSKADPIFANFISNILSKEFLERLPARLILSLVLLLFLIPLLIMRPASYVSPLGWLVKTNWGREMIVVTSMVTLVLGTFLLVQWPYVFANVALETDLSRYGVATYSEYVQRGFADLLKVVTLVFATAWAGVLIGKNQQGNERKILNGVQALLGLEFVIFVASIFRRVWLYQNSHGLSLARLYGLALLVMISGLVVTMALRYFYKGIKWAKFEAAWIVGAILLTIFLNFESLVIKNPPTVNNRVDHVYLARLPADGYEGWLKAYQWSNSLLSKEASNTGLINRETRRDLYYSGLIIEELSNNFHSLIKEYGSDEEIRAYFLAEIAKEKDMVEKYTVFGDGESTRREKDQQLRELDEVAEVMNKENWRERLDIVLVGSQTSRGFGFVFLRNEDLPKKHFGFQNKTDALLNWNYKRFMAYQKMKTEIGFANIFRLQDQFLNLNKKVAGQPSEEQGYDVDISLKSPFLQ